MPESTQYVVYPPVTLRVEPHAIPQVREAFDYALRELSPALERLGQEGYILEPWLGDPFSAMVQEAYNSRVMDAPDGPYHALLKFRDELQKVRDQLAASEDAYRQAEGDNSDLWGRA
jgi:hypothetical protein